MGALFSCWPSVTLARPRQSTHGLASLWACAVGPSSCSRSLLVSLPTHLDNHPQPSSSLLTTCASLCHWAGRSIQQVTSSERLPLGLAARHSMSPTTSPEQDCLRVGVLVLCQD